MPPNVRRGGLEVEWIQMAGVASQFRLRLWFAVGSFGTILAISLVLALWVSRFLTTSLLERESEVTQEFLESIVSIDGAAIFRDYVAEGAEPGPTLLDFARHIVSIPGALRVNIYAPSKRVLWSTERQIIGQQFPVNDELQKAFRGERVTEVGELDGRAKAEHVALEKYGLLIEAYIPIRADGGRGPVVGVVEFYKAPMALEDTIRRGRLIVWVGAGLSALTLFLLLYWIVQRAASLIENQQQRLAQMQTFSAIGQMAGAVAHSLRNPMASVRSSAELWKSDLPPGEQQTADEVIREVDRMDGYVRDLLAYCRAEAQALQTVDPVALMRAIVAKSEGHIERHHIQASLVDRRSDARPVQADPMLLEQALTSLVTNALEAMPNGGDLLIALSEGRGARIQLEITDTGSGIAPDLLQRVAQSYFTTKERGLGLGLVLARGIIERLGGELRFDSAPGSGTRVVVNLRAAP